MTAREGGWSLAARVRASVHRQAAQEQQAAMASTPAALARGDRRRPTGRDGSESADERLTRGPGWKWIQ